MLTMRLIVPSPLLIILVIYLTQDITSTVFTYVLGVSYKHKLLGICNATDKFLFLNMLKRLRRKDQNAQIYVRLLFKMLKVFAIQYVN